MIFHNKKNRSSKDDNVMSKARANEFTENMRIKGFA